MKTRLKVPSVFQFAKTDDRHFKELLKARVDEIERGEVETIPWEVVLRDLKKKFRLKKKSKR